ncbi:hypothetical protein GGF46_003247 [Coemansia sp. RSA 552]|nr:hypothetical protein GGF46_003247 [Coemansia sp. RSA 552]
MAGARGYSRAALAHLCAREFQLCAARAEAARVREHTERALDDLAQESTELRRRAERGRRRIAALRRRAEQRARWVEEASGCIEEASGRVIEASGRVEKTPGSTTDAAGSVDEQQQQQQQQQAGVGGLDEPAMRQRISKAVVTLRQDRIILEDVRAMLARARARVSRDLQLVFPLELGADGWTICGLRVAREGDRRRTAEETAAALGLVACVVDYLARSLCVPLRFPLLPRGSHSLAINPLGPVELPLFTSDSRSRSGLRLLAADIEQLLALLGISEVDRAQLLPNLVQLLLAVESSSFA